MGSEGSMFATFYQGITIIIAVAAILSPIATAFINNLYQLKLKKLEIQQNNQCVFDLHTREIFENYIRAAGIAVSHATESAVQEYGACYQLALHYASNNTGACMLILNNQIRTRNWDKAQESLDMISVMLRKETEELRKPSPQLSKRKLNTKK